MNEEEMYEFSAGDKERALTLVDRLADIAEDFPPSITIAALGTLLTYTIVNAASTHNEALAVVKQFTGQLVNAIDDQFTK